MNTHLQQGMGTAVLVHVLLSNGGALDVIMRTDEALLTNVELRVPAWKRQKLGHLYGLAVLCNYNYNNLVSPAPVMSVETRFRGAAAVSMIFSDTHCDGDTFRVPLTLLMTMEEAITRHTTDVASSTTSVLPAG